jgi:16S rRNA (uracil1498-N3)-methyltransferase
MRFFFTEKPMTLGEKITVRGSDARHIRKVLRLQPGDDIGLFDGLGTAYTARIDSFIRDGVVVEVRSSVPAMTDSPVQIVIAQAYLKDKKMDGLARQLTELGTAKWIPFFAERSVPALDRRRLAGRLERWQKISREALKQCKRGRLMAIEPVAGLQDVLLQARSCAVKILFWEDQPRPLSLQETFQQGAAPEGIFAILGPEGGFSPAEVEAAVAEGFLTAGLGPRILRAETAATTAAALLQFLFGDLGKSP